MGMQVNKFNSFLLRRHFASRPRAITPFREALFRVEAQRGEAQPKTDLPQKSTKERKENKQFKLLSMRSLRSFVAKILPKMKSFLT
jgi:hypothetical protein